MKLIRNEVQSKCPKEVVALVSATAGGLIGASHPGELPTNGKHVANVRHAVKTAQRSSEVSGGRADDLFVLMQQAKLGDSKGDFIRELKTAPEPAVIVARDYQLDDLVRFCTYEPNFLILTVDQLLVLENLM